MRHPFITLLSLAALVFAASGCRQTSPSTGAIAPMGSLSPVAPGQTPTLGSFGSTTRVTPPPTGSFGSGTRTTPPPNGSFNPSANFGTGAPATNFAPQPNLGAFNQPMGNQPMGNQPMGSGVQPVNGFNQPAINQHANWTETGTTIPAGGFGQARDPRAGGMQVIDLMAAPNPSNVQAGNFQGSRVNNTASLVISPNLMPPQPSFQQPAFPQPGFQQPAFQPTQQNFQNSQANFQATQPNSQLTQSRAPATLQAQSAPQFPSTRPQFETRTSPSPLPNASTATLPTEVHDSKLNWRRPGTQF